MDLLKPAELDSLVKLFAAESKADLVIPTAAKLGQGVAQVKKWASQQLQEGPSLYPKVQFLPLPCRLFGRGGGGGSPRCTTGPLGGWVDGWVGEKGSFKFSTCFRVPHQLLLPVYHHLLPAL